MELNKLHQHFFSLFGNPGNKPRLFFAPGRVNLIGEHTDYNGGFVLPCALQYGTYLAIRKNNEAKLRFASLNIETSADVSVANISKKSETPWVNYPLGVFDQFRQQQANLTGFDLLFSGDIPSNAGLSSSASIEMVTAFALNAFLEPSQLGMIDLIRLSRRAENEFVGVNCGIMDQFAVGMCSADHALFLNCKTLEFNKIPFILPNTRLIIGNTNKPRELAGSRYNERVAECQLAVASIDPFFPMSSLGEISFMQFYKMQDQIADERIRMRARHVISENQRVLNSVACLMKGDLSQFGALMNASHESLRDNYEVTGFELDTLVEEAWKINGVLGARMTGAGFGGCTVNLVRENVVEEFINKVGEGYRSKTGLTADFYLARVSDGVREIND